MRGADIARGDARRSHAAPIGEPLFRARRAFDDERREVVMQRSSGAILEPHGEYRHRRLVGHRHREWRERFGHVRTEGERARSVRVRAPFAE